MCQSVVLTRKLHVKVNVTEIIRSDTSKLVYSEGCLMSASEKGWGG